MGRAGGYEVKRRQAMKIGLGFPENLPRRMQTPKKED
jgi:hypothetical protein